MSDHTQSGLPENIAALLSYVLGWLTGLVFLLIDQRPYVRFHAAQSVVVFLGLHILRVVLGMIFGMGWWFGGVGSSGAFTLGAFLVNLIGLLSLILWIVLMVKVFQGVRFKLPVAGGVAESLAGRAGLTDRRMRRKRGAAQGKTPTPTSPAQPVAGRNALARWEWLRSSGTAGIDKRAYDTQIQSQLKRLTNAAVASAIGVSLYYAAEIRRGRRRPHARHWPVLAKVVRTFADHTSMKGRAAPSR